MWFDDEELHGSRFLRGRRMGGRNTILKVNTKLVDKKNSKRIGISALLLVVIAGTTICVWLGCVFAGRLLFSRNDRFLIKNLNVQEGAVITRDLIKEYTQIREGLNLFAFDIVKVRKDFIRQSPNVKSMKITRQLPDTMSVSIIERKPIARIGRRSPFVSDGEGYVFGLRLGGAELPIITGYRDSGLKPGSRLQGLAIAAALELLECCNDQSVGLQVAEIEVNNPEQIVLYVPEGGKVKEVALSWPDMGKRTGRSRHELSVRLSNLVESMRSNKGRASSRFNATLDGQIYSSGDGTTI